jgi:hypothetical protein
LPTQLDNINDGTANVHDKLVAHHHVGGRGANRSTTLNHPGDNHHLNNDHVDDDLDFHLDNDHVDDLDHNVHGGAGCSASH